MIARDGGHDASPTEGTRGGRPNSHVPIRAGRPNLGSQPPPLSRNESNWMSRYVADLYCTVSHNVNIVLLQCAPNLLNLLLIHATNTNAAVNLTITVLHNFKLKRDTVQAKNDFPAQ